MPAPKPIDSFTLNHAFVGAVLGGMGASAMGALGIALFWEAVENPLKRRVPDVFPNPYPDTRANSFFDMAAWMIGWVIGNRVRGEDAAVKSEMGAATPRRLWLKPNEVKRC